VANNEELKGREIKKINYMEKCKQCEILQAEIKELMDIIIGLNTEIDDLKDAWSNSEG